MFGERLVLGPILDEVSLHELIVQDQNREMQQSFLVHSDGLVDNLRQMVLLLAEFDLLAPQVPEHFQLLVILSLVDKLNLLHVLFLPIKLSLRLFLDILDLLRVWVLL